MRIPNLGPNPSNWESSISIGSPRPYLYALPMNMDVEIAHQMTFSTLGWQLDGLQVTRPALDSRPVVLQTGTSPVNRSGSKYHRSRLVQYQRKEMWCLLYLRICHVNIAFYLLNEWNGYGRRRSGGLWARLDFVHFGNISRGKVVTRGSGVFIRCRRD